MDNINNDMIALTMPLKRQYLKLAVDLAVNSVAGYGHDEKVRSSLELSVEELFVYLCDNVSGDETVEIKCWNGIYYTGIEFAFKALNFNFKEFNLTANVADSGEGKFEEIGLLLIARTVDRLTVFVEKNGGTKITLVKERKYAEITENLTGNYLKQGCIDRLIFSVPTDGEIKICCGMVLQNYKNVSKPDFLKYPGKITDMIASGELGALMAAYENGTLAGVIFWQNNDKTSKFYGPYVFSDEAAGEVSEAVINEYIESMSKTKLKNIYCSQELKGFPRRYFEKIGSLKKYLNGVEIAGNAYYSRQLKEDTGAVSWCHESLGQFVKAEYGKFNLPREVRLIKDFGETEKNSYSVISCEFQKSDNSVFLRPLIYSGDAFENVEAHINLLKSENYENIFFELDTGIEQHCNFAPAVLKCGFVPKFIIAYGGAADLVILQKEPNKVE